MPERVPPIDTDAREGAARLTGAQISAITRVDYRAIGTGVMGDGTARLRKIYFDVVRGRAPKYRDWCYPVYEVGQARQPEEHASVKAR